MHRLFQPFALQPHRTRSFKLSTDPFFVEKVRDMVGLYLNPPDHALVLCVDEKSQIQALNAIRRGSFGSVKDLVEKIDSFVQHYNRSHRPFVWTATADSILEKIARLCSSISGTRH